MKQLIQTKTFYFLFVLQFGFINSTQLFAQPTQNVGWETNVGGGFFISDRLEPYLLLNGQVRKLIANKRNGNEWTVGISYDQLLYNRRDVQYSYELVNIGASYRFKFNTFFTGLQLGAGLYGEDGFDYIGPNLFIGQETGFQVANLTFIFDYRYNMGDGFFWGEELHLFSLKAGIRF